MEAFFGPGQDFDESTAFHVEQIDFLTWAKSLRTCVIITIIAPRVEQDQLK
jgi:hypothetical protein